MEELQKQVLGFTQDITNYSIGILPQNIQAISLVISHSEKGIGFALGTTIPSRETTLKLLKALTKKIESMTPEQLAALVMDEKLQKPDSKPE